MTGRIARFTMAHAGASAVEFALVAPLFMLLMFGAIAYSAVMTTSNGVQQLVAEGARATIGGLSNAERDQLARNSITQNIASYPFLDPTHLTISTSGVGGTPASFSVTLTYDMSTMFVFTLAGIIPLPGKTVLRTAVIQCGGY